MIVWLAIYFMVALVMWGVFIGLKVSDPVTNFIMAMAWPIPTFMVCGLMLVESAKE